MLEHKQPTHNYANKKDQQLMGVLKVVDWIRRGFKQSTHHSVDSQG